MIRKMIEMVCEITGSGAPIFGALPYRQGENMSLYANVEKANSLLKWKCNTKIEDGLKETVEWYAKNKT